MFGYSQFTEMDFYRDFNQYFIMKENNEINTRGIIEIIIAILTAIIPFFTSKKENE